MDYTIRRWRPIFLDRYHPDEHVGGLQLRGEGQREHAHIRRLLGDSARFVNWLANGQLTGPEGKNTTETGTYTLSGATSTLALMQVTRNPGSTWVLPNVNEWYKASFYVGGGTNAGYWTYATQSNTPPSNVLSATGTNNANFYDNGSTAPTGLTPVGAFAASPGPYGTYDMGGDVWQWNETDFAGMQRGTSRWRLCFRFCFPNVGKRRQPPSSKRKR